MRLGKKAILVAGLAVSAIALPGLAHAQLPPLFGEAEDSSRQFQRLENTYFVADRIASFDPSTGTGTIEWKRHRRRATYSFLKVDTVLAPDTQNEDQPSEYDEAAITPFRLDFVSPRTVRIRVSTGVDPVANGPSEMLVGTPPKDASWAMTQTPEAVTYTSAFGSVRIVRNPVAIEIRDAAGKLLTRTQNKAGLSSFAAPLPFSFIRRADDFGRQIAVPFELSPNDGVYGFGESFTRLNKRGQRVDLVTRDAMGVQTPLMYKPVPVFLNSAGYGMFIHSSAPISVDVGKSYDQSNVVYVNDPSLDTLVFLGQPKDILSEYTALTGKSPVPPLWSFGFWMSRITYNTEAQVRDVAAKLRQYQIPTDVLHLDTGWFEYDWRNDYEFSKTRFQDPAKMMRDLREDGFRISLWQLPYFNRKNALYEEIVSKGLAVRNAAGQVPDEDAVLDFTNPDAVKWYQGKIANLLKMGASVIKVDFGEGAPMNGVYANGSTGGSSTTSTRFGITRQRSISPSR